LRGRPRIGRDRGRGHAVEHDAEQGGHSDGQQRDAALRPWALIELRIGARIVLIGALARQFRMDRVDARLYGRVSELDNRQDEPPFPLKPCALRRAALR